MPEPDTICGYGLVDVRRSLRDSIDRRDRRASDRWAAELIATPGAVGSLWASFWLAWAQGTGSASPTIPIILKQTWVTMNEAVNGLAEIEEDYWMAFRNDAAVRRTASEMTIRLLTQPRQNPVIWPSKELVLYDVSTLNATAVPAAADSEPVMKVWQRGDDALVLRYMAGRWIHALERGEIRSALSVVAWTMLPHAQQGLTTPMRIAERGPPSLTLKQRCSPIWFWLEIGRALLVSRSLHRGWHTMHVAVSEGMRVHYKRWTAVDRMRILLAWILQIHASYLPHPESIWSAPSVQHTIGEIDLPYKEIAAELVSGPASVSVPASTSGPAGKGKPKEPMSKSESKMAEADAVIMAALGITDDD
jgi:hypothetical protein